MSLDGRVAALVSRVSVQCPTLPGGGRYHWQLVVSNGVFTVSTPTSAQDMSNIIVRNKDGSLPEEVKAKEVIKALQGIFCFQYFFCKKNNAF